MQFYIQIFRYRVLFATNLKNPSLFINLITFFSQLKLFIAYKTMRVKNYCPDAYNEYGLKLLFRGKHAQPAE